MDIDTLAQRNWLGGMNVHTTIVSGLAGNEVRATIVLQKTSRGDREAGSGSGPRVTLKLGGWCWNDVVSIHDFMEV